MKASELYAKQLAEIVRVTAPSLKAIQKATKKGALVGPDAWYQASYDIFMPRTNFDPASAAEFLRRVAYAYSWAPTIARADPRKNFVNVKGRIEYLRNVERRTPYQPDAVRLVRKLAISSVQRALHISDDKGAVVIVSKVLHFWDFELAPMIDANIARAWKTMRHQIRRCEGGLSYRELDQRLFNYAKFATS